MTIRNILMFTTEFPPTPVVGALRLGKLAAFLPEWGWRPIIVTVAPSAHTPARDFMSDLPLAPLTYRLSGIEEHTVWGPNPIAIGSVLRRRLSRGQPTEGGGSLPEAKPAGRSWQARAAASLSRNLVPDEYVFWIPAAVRRGIQISKRNRIDAVWASFPWPSALIAARRISARIHAPLVIDFRDSWASWPPITSARPWRQRIENRIESSLLADASAATAVSEEMRREIEERHPILSGRTRTVPQGWDPTEAEELELLPTTSSADGVLRVVHAGSIEPAMSDPTTFFDALERLHASGKIDGSNLRVTFVGKQLMDLTSLAAKRGLGDIVEVLPHMERQQLLRFLRAADVLLLIRTHPARDWITGKLWDYLTARRTILVVGFEDTAAARVVAETRMGTACHPFEAGTIARTLEGLVDRFRKDGLTPTPDEAKLETTSMRTIAGEVAGLLDGIRHA